MSRLSYGQLEAVWVQAGGPKALAPLMAAIALAESGGDPAAVNPADNGGRQTSWGLWQISDGTHNAPAGWSDPVGNARLAVAKYHSQGLPAWGTYDSGAYRQYLRGGVPPAAVPPGTGSGSGSGQGNINVVAGVSGALKGLFPALSWDTAFQGGAGTAGAVEDVAGVVGAGVKVFGQLVHDIGWLFVPSHWVRILSGVTGVVLLVPGVYFLGKARSGGDMSLALGIALTVLAGVELFIAFHNLPDSVTSFPALMGYVRDSVQGVGP